MNISSLHLHITGASGSGTSTLAADLGRELGCEHFDTDQFFWLPSQPPFQNKRPIDQRLRLLGEALDSAQSWVLSGSLCGWGDPLIPRFDLVIFLAIPKEIRMQRLLAREKERYGPAAIAPDGALHKAHREFIDWAAQYDDADETMRSRRLHDAWLARLPCDVLRFDGDMTTEARVARVRQYLRSHWQ